MGGELARPTFVCERHAKAAACLLVDGRPRGYRPAEKGKGARARGVWAGPPGGCYLAAFLPSATIM